MEIRVLRYFLTVVREENITRAAEVLHITGNSDGCKVVSQGYEKDRAYR